MAQTKRELQAATDLGALVAMKRVFSLGNVDESDVASEDLLATERLGANLADVSCGWKKLTN